MNRISEKKIGLRQRERKSRQINYRTLVMCGIVIFIVAAALFFCISMIRNINQRMNQSATSNLLNTTQVIEDALESQINKDLESLKIVGELRKRGEYLGAEQVQTFCDTLGFDWIGVVDAQENGVDCFADKFQATDIPCYEQWTPEETGYSDAYIGQSGRSQITLWIPIYEDQKYIGTVFGNVIFMKYYSASVFTFYEGEGRTYLFDASDGVWILKSLGTDGVSTRQKDIYSLLLASGNEEEKVHAFRQIVEERKIGTGVFDFNAEESYLCFMPLSSSTDWYVITVIAKDVLLKEASEVQRMIRWVFIVLCVTLVFFAIAFAVWMIQKTKKEEAYYREALFANISANLDSAFLIYEKSSRKTAFVSDNVKRLLGLERDWLRENAGRLFDWCKIEQGDSLRTIFLDGMLDKAAVREVCVENEMGVNSRYIRLELIPADLGQEIAVLTDITKDKDIQSSLLDAMQRAEAADKARNNFLSSMSHDIRTPLNGIVGMTAIAAAHLEDKNRVRNCLTKINEASAQLLHLINEVLDMSQIESGKIELSNEPFNLAELFQDVLNVSYPGIQQKNHTVNVRIHLMKHEEVIGDVGRLKRVVTNLLSNAIKYTPSGGKITLELQEKPQKLQGYGCYELIVQDNGIGMSPEFQKKLFEPFEREEDVRISRIQGTGLGMSIVKNIVSLMMGDIQVQSEKGKGSTFRVMINMRLDEQERELDGQLDSLPVLVVDDDVITCMTAADMLCDIKMTGEWASNGADAIRKVAERKQRGEDYMAVILDWKMPEMDGVETARRIRTEVDAQIPIIILTAYDWSEIEREAKEAGVDAFLSKPIYKAKLLWKMTEIASGNTETSELSGVFFSGNIPPGRRVLLAEDNELNMEIAVELLRAMGIQADCVENGAVAAERFAYSEPGTYDLILMDIQMPKMNGYEATRAIRSMDRPDSQTIPVIAMTADAFKKDVQAAYAAGMNEHLTKPISVERLTEVMVKFLTGSA